MEIKTVLDVGQKDVYVNFDDAIWQKLSTFKIKNQCKGYRGFFCGDGHTIL